MTSFWRSAHREMLDVLVALQTVCGVFTGGAGQDEAGMQVLEGQSSWLVHIIGAVIRGRNGSSAGENQVIMLSVTCS